MTLLKFMTQGVLKTHGICLMMYFKNNRNAGPFFFYFMDILEEKKVINFNKVIQKRTF
jgi:hypothetical protein